MTVGAAVVFFGLFLINLKHDDEDMGNRFAAVGCLLVSGVLTVMATMGLVNP